VPRSSHRSPHALEPGAEAPAPSGEAHLRIGGLEIHVEGREFPQADDYWDGNWVVAAVRCASSHSSVAFRGPILHLSEVVQLLEGCEAMVEGEAGSATLPCSEPHLYVELEAGPRGRVRATVELRHDGERHVYEFALDRDAVARIAAECRALLAAFPILGEPPPESAADLN
jgi:hypothetical protein